MRRRFLVTILICFGAFVVAGTTCLPNFYWRDYSHKIPCDALEVSSGLYVGQVHVKAGLYPAAIYPYRTSAITVYGSRLNVHQHVKILCTPEPEKFYWEPVNFNNANMSAMENAVIGGFHKHYVLYIGLIYNLDSWKVGTVYDVDAGRWKGIYVWDNAGRRLILPEFQLLKYNSSINNDFLLKHEDSNVG